MTSTAFYRIATTTILLALIIIMAINYSQKETFKYVFTQKVFDNFHGKKYLGEKLDVLSKQHKKVLDSLLVQIANHKERKEIKLLENNRKLYLKIEREFAAEEEQKAALYTSQIWKQINDYTEEFGENNKYTFVFGVDGKGSMMYAEKENDVTDQLIEFINNKYEDE